MSGNRRLNWLRTILAVKAALTLLAWGLPALLAPPRFFSFLECQLLTTPCSSGCLARWSQRLGWPIGMPTRTLFTTLR